MAELGGTLDETFHTTAPVERARAHFADLAPIRAATKQGDRFEDLGGGRLHVVLKPQRHGTHTFVGDYVVRYRIEGEDVVWSTETGNLRSEGRARFRAEGGRSAIVYHHTIAFEMGVNRVVAAMLSPVVGQLTKASLRRYVERMIASVEGRPDDGEA